MVISSHVVNSIHVKNLSMISNLSTSFLRYDVIHAISFVHMLNSSTLLSLPNMVAYFTKPPLLHLTLPMEVGTYHRQARYVHGYHTSR
jgi:hypothetical protein